MTGHLMATLRAQCVARAGHLAFPESGDPRILKAAAILLKERSCAAVTLFGEPEKVRAVARSHSIDLEPVEDRLHWISSTIANPLSAALTTRLQSQAGIKGRVLDSQVLATQADDPFMQAGELLYEGKVDAVIAGATVPTSQVIRAAISTVGLAKNIRTVSGAFLMIREPGPGGTPCYFVFADCGVVIEPTAEQLSDIAQSSVTTWQQVFSVMGSHMVPRVAFLSFSTKGSAEHPAAQKMSAAYGLFQRARPDIAADGELQFDAAIDPEIGARKAPGSRVAGQANCFIFPELNSGNLGYKIAQRLGGLTAIGPILQGLAKPYSDLSRGATTEDIVAAAYINLLRSSNAVNPA